MMGEDLTHDKKTWWELLMENYKYTIKISKKTYLQNEKHRIVFPP